MKLWQKITLISAAVLLAVVAVCSAFLLVYAKTSILDITVSQGADKHKNLVNSFSNMIGYYVEEHMNDVARQSVVKYCFASFADETSVLADDAGTIYTQLAIDPGKYVKPSEVYALEHVVTTVNGRVLLMLCSAVGGRGEAYRVYTVQDISGVYESIARMGWIFAAVSLACIALGVALITLLVRRGMKPLAQLGASARSMAAGDYIARAKVAGRDEVGALASDFNAMAEAVEAHVMALTETAQRQKLFIAGLTHEFKTPMTSVLIHSDTLLNTNMNDEERERSLRHIYEQIRWLERLTQKLLQLITLNRDIETQPVSAQALAGAVADSLADTLAQRDTPLVVECDGSVLIIDRDLMQSAVVNLVDNASKASAPGSPVTLAVKGGIIRVTDHGCGIPEGELSRVFEPFYMADRSRSKKQGGSGLGLALAKRIAEAHGAELVITSEAGRGTVATITFR